METLKVIESRRSIRKFQNKEIPATILEKILRAAMLAPSAYNQQPWQFIVINERKLLDMIPNIHPYADMCKTAPLAILVCADLKLEKSKNMWLFDCAAASQNILLAARDLGIGTCWANVYFRKEREEAFKKAFNLPEYILPIALIPMGYPAEEKPKVDRYRKDRIHYNSY